MDLVIDDKMTERVVCPSCGHLTSTAEASAIECRYMRIPLAWRLFCPECGIASVIPYRGYPELFEINPSGVWTIPRA
jgi:hypothetical protein